MAGCSKDVVRLQIEGMESLVVTVTGYKGKERFDLIKLIDRAGGNYVGNMSPAITHLVCWKYEGGKYEIARRLKMHIVNHRWVEDCIRQRRLISESPYCTTSGEEVGPLQLTVNSFPELFPELFLGNHSNKRKKQSKRRKREEISEDYNFVMSESDSNSFVAQ